MRHHSGIPSTLLALLATGFSLYGAVETISLADYYRRVENKVGRWCQRAPGCTGVAWSGNLARPELTITFKRGRGVSQGKLEADLAEIGALAVPQKSPNIAGRPPRVVVREV